MKEEDYSKAIEVLSVLVTEEEYEAATELIRSRDEKGSD